MRGKGEAEAIQRDQERGEGRTEQYIGREMGSADEESGLVGRLGGGKGAVTFRSNVNLSMFIFSLNLQVSARMLSLSMRVVRCLRCAQSTIPNNRP